MTTQIEHDEAVSPALVDDEGAITAQLELVLLEVFLRFATLTAANALPSSSVDKQLTIETIFNNSKTLSRSNLNAFSLLTNGEEMSDDTFSQCVEFLDIIEGDSGEERMTFKGFLQLYQLQTENDERETLNDAKAWGYDSALMLVEKAFDSIEEAKTLDSAASGTN